MSSSKSTTISRNSAGHLMMKTSARSAFQIEFLLDQTFSWFYADCDHDALESTFCTGNSTQPCPHAKALAGCLTVSKRWFNFAARHLWRHYADFDSFVKLIVPNAPATDSKVSCSPLSKGCQTNSIYSFHISG
jgi:hypothetical protein